MTTLPVRLAVILTVLATLISSSTCSAQVSSTLPNASYFLGFPRFYEGEYLDAERFFRGNRGLRFGDSRYVDSVCYWTMQAECFYHMGNSAEAIELYERALRLYLNHQNTSWQSDIIPASIQFQRDTSAISRARITWGSSKRIKGVANVADSFQVRFNLGFGVAGVQDGNALLRQREENRVVNVTEIMRCVSLCLHRRRFIKGPTTKIDPLTSRLVAGLKNGVAKGSVLGCYNGICLGIAYASQEEWAKASSTIKQSLELPGGLDHPLTPVGLLELAYIGLSIEKDPEACLLYTSPSPRDATLSRMPSSA